MSTNPKAATTAKTKEKGTGSKKGAKVNAKVVKANLEQAAKDAATNERESKYNYPEGISADEKKKFRRDARSARSTFEQELKQLKKDKDEASYAKKEKEFQKWQKQTYSQAA